MNRVEFCQLLMQERVNKKVSLYAIQKSMGLTFQQAKRIEIGENSFNIKKAIEYLASIGSALCLENETGQHTIKEYIDFINWLIKAREGKYTQRSLANEANCSYSAIANTESQKSIVSIDVFLKLVEILGASIQIKSTQ